MLHSHYGPLFHRWLPDGPKDGIVLPVDDSAAELRVWFERFGIVDADGYVRYKENVQEIDPLVMETQGILEAGPLYGHLVIRDVSDDAVKAIKNEVQGNAAYQRFGKRVTTRLIYPSVSRFIRVLRLVYGQYWIKELETWDSRERSLGAYCVTLQLQCSHDDGATWLWFMPNNPVYRLVGEKPSASGFRDNYLTHDDWVELAGKIAFYELTVTQESLRLATQLLYEGNLRHALIEAVVALELAIDDLLRSGWDEVENKEAEFGRFTELGLPTKISVVAKLTGWITAHQAARVREAVRLRNNLVHQGEQLLPQSRKLITDLIEAIGALMPEMPQKFPSAGAFERWRRAPADVWRKTTDQWTVDCVYTMDRVHLIPPSTIVAQCIGR